MLGLTIFHETFVTDPEYYFIWLWSLLFRPRTGDLIGLTRTLYSMVKNLDIWRQDLLLNTELCFKVGRL